MNAAFFTVFIVGVLLIILIVNTILHWDDCCSCCEEVYCIDMCCPCEGSTIVDDCCSCCAKEYEACNAKCCKCDGAILKW